MYGCEGRRQEICQNWSIFVSLKNTKLPFLESAAVGLSEQGRGLRKKDEREDTGLLYYFLLRNYLISFFPLISLLVALGNLSRPLDIGPLNVAETRLH